MRERERKKCEKLILNNIVSSALWRTVLLCEKCTLLCMNLFLFYFFLVIFKIIYRSDVRLLIHCVGHDIQRIQSSLFTDSSDGRSVGRSVVVVVSFQFQFDVRFVDSTHSVANATSKPTNEFTVFVIVFIGIVTSSRRHTRTNIKRMNKKINEKKKI